MQSLILSMAITVLFMTNLNCQRAGGVGGVTGSNIASLSVEKVDELTHGSDYDSIELALEDQDGNVAAQETTTEENEVLDTTVPAGTYLFSLSYLLEEKVVFSTSFCQDADDVATQTHSLVAGDNSVGITVCDSETKAVNPTASVVIQPTIKKSDGNGNEPGNLTAEQKEGKKLYVKGPNSCESCHGEDGAKITGKEIPGSYSDADFISFTAANMPGTDPESCDQDCAEKILAYLKTLD